MLWATAANPPTKGSMLHAGNGTCGDCEGEALSSVVWCGVPKSLLPKGNGRDVYPRVHVNGRAVCLSARCVLVCCCTIETSAQLHGAVLLYRHLCMVTQGLLGSLHFVCCVALHCVCCAALHYHHFVCCASLLGAVNCTALCALDQANQQHSASPPRGSGQWNSCNARPLCLHAVWRWNSCNALPHCQWAVGIGTPTRHRHTVCGQSAVELPQRTATLPGGSGQWTGQWKSCNAPPHCLRAVGSATPTMHRHTA